MTPTYYVYFTSATIVTSAILFRGFKGTPTSIATVVMGFIQICAGVVLLQLSKSSKDVPDTAVFKGDLDQIRTIAEQEEPESEPRADTIRGSAAIIRALSKRRTAREAEEVRTLHSEAMEPIGENEEVEWDGLRRRKTVLTPGQRSIKRAKTVHPPLGMAHFPHEHHHHHHHDNVSEAGSDDVHPGFFPRFGRRSTRKSSTTATSTRRASPSPVAMQGLHPKSSQSSTSTHEHVFGLPPGLARDDGHGGGGIDTSYHGGGGGGGGGGSAHIHFVDERDRASSQGSGLTAAAAPPRPPPHAHGTRRQFSFQNAVPFFHRRKSDTSDHHHHNHPGAKDDSGYRPDSAGTVSTAAGGGDGGRPTSRGGFSFAALKPGHHHGPRLGGGGGGGGGGAAAVANATEEERAGLVKGDPAKLSSSSAVEAAMRSDGKNKNKNKMNCVFSLKRYTFKALLYTSLCFCIMLLITIIFIGLMS